jgi:exodeoxyribonuclease-3
VYNTAAEDALMKIATWNVNSIRSREERLLKWLDRQQPDVVCLQELKVTEDKFPFEALREAGYYAAVHGQKTYNGVAILSRTEPQNIEMSFDDGVDDPQARVISAVIENVRILSVYVPNGASVGSEKWDYKLEWFERLHRYLEGRADPQSPLALCGDFNIAPDDNDVAHPQVWQDSVLCHEDGRRALKKVSDWGLVDAFRLKHPEGGIYSWWDYRRLAFPKNDGLRIDHIFVTAPLTDRVVSAEVDRQERKGKLPSDHAPVIVELSD